MQIRVSPDALRNVANQQGEIINNIAEETTRMNELNKQLSEAWEGAAGAQAHNSLEEIRTGIKKTLADAGDSTRKLITVADAFESIDSGETIMPIGQFHTGHIPMPPMPTFMLSMPGLVRIDPDRVRDIGEQCMAVANVIAENAEAFTNTLKALANDWEGRSYVRYSEEANEIIQALTQIQDSIAAFAKKIITAANRYEEIDNAL